jgi:hypothetical protein
MGSFFSNLKIDFFNFSISMWWYGQFFFKFHKQFFPNFPCGINEFFQNPRLPNLFKICKNYLFTAKK